MYRKIVLLAAAIGAIALLAIPAIASHPGDNGRVVFASARDGDQEIYAMGLDGSNVVQLTSNTYADKDPSWGTEGRVAFVSNRDGNDEIYTMRFDGTDVVRLTNFAGDDEHPTWGENGQVVWDRTPTTGSVDLYELYDQGSTEDGTTVVPTQLTTGSADDERPSINSEGDIAYTTETSGTENIAILHTDGTTTQLATSGAGDEWDPDWSPDNTQIVYTKGQGTSSDIYKMNADGTSRSALVANVGAADSRAAFWPEAGTKVEYTSDVSGNTEVYKVNLDGTNKVNVSNNTASDNASEVRPINGSGATIDDVVLGDDPNDSTKQTATIYFDHGGVSATYECQIDGGGYSSCTSPKLYTGLDPAEGHTIDVRATVGGLTETPVSATWSP